MLPSSVPPWSCRSGLSVLLQGVTVQDKLVPRPFSLSVQTRVTGGQGTQELAYVARLTERTLREVRAELCSGAAALAGCGRMNTPSCNTSDFARAFGDAVPCVRRRWTSGASCCRWTRLAT